MKDFRPVHRAIVQAKHLVSGQREREEQYDKETFILEKNNEQMRMIIRVLCALVLAYFHLPVAIITAIIIFLVGEGMCRLKWLKRHHRRQDDNDDDIYQQHHDDNGGVDPRVKLRHRVASISEVDSSYWKWEKRKYIPNGLEGITLQHFLTTATEEMRRNKFDISNKKLAMEVMRLFWRKVDTTTTICKLTNQDQKQTAPNIGRMIFTSSPQCAPPSPPHHRNNNNNNNNIAKNNNKPPNTTRRRSSQQQIAEALNFVHIGF